MRHLAVTIIVVSLAAASGVAKAQTSGARGGAQDNSGAMTSRMERLEEQLADLQGVVAAVETLAKNSGSSSTGYSAAAGPSGDQVRQLSEQIADLTQRIERLEARLGAAGGTQPRSQADAATPADGFDQKEQLPPLSQAGAPPPSVAGRPPASPRPQPSPGYATADAEPAAPPSRDDRPAPVSPAAKPPQTPSAASSSAAGPARALFDQAYSAFNRREYPAADTYFQQLLDQYPADQLAGAAQFWLGESAFIGGEYKLAADRYLKTFTAYPSNAKAPEALLKLAISLRRLGETPAACDSFAELKKRFPQASPSIQQRAETEKKRANCT